GTFDMDASRTTAIASRLAPTLELRCVHYFRATQAPVGAGLAREGGGTFDMDASRTTAIASRLAPTLELRCMHYFRATQVPVGASLLAMAAAHPTLNDLIHRSSNLPPQYRYRGGFPLHTGKHIFGFSYMGQAT
ncbi:hypothetical protein, partial [Pseudomonas corrugata]|uniref:hypothetical protein n=1 Tax=Pseudomonas corrugata TaxID=47879 RepID=UPI003ED9E9E9